MRTAQPSDLAIDATRDMSGVALGSVIGGRYRVDRVLGIGGMGTVFEGVRLGLDQPVAIKVLHAERASSREHLARFAREARAAASIESEHTVRVLDVGSLDTGAPFMVLELLRGIDLARLLKQHGPLSVEETVTHVLTVCEVLAEAHKKGIVHRDLKPSNLFLARRPEGSKVLKVLDFGVTKFLGTTHDAQDDRKDDEGEFLTNTSSVVGSPQYIAPEQIRDPRKVDTRVDLWALGIVLFRLLTKKYPFVGATSADLYASILVNPPVSLRSENASIPEELDAVVKRCLEKDPKDRYANIVELATALVPFSSSGQETLDRIKRIVAGEAPGPTLLHGADDEMELATIDLMLDATVVAPMGGDDHLTTSAGLATATGPSARRPSRVPFVIAGLGVLLTFVVAGIWVFVVPLSTSDAKPVNAASVNPPPPPARESATPMEAEPLPTAAPLPSASAVSVALPATTSHPTKPLKPVKPPPPTPKPALSEIPSYGGRK